MDLQRDYCAKQSSMTFQDNQISTEVCFKGHYKEPALHRLRVNYNGAFFDK